MTNSHVKYTSILWILYNLVKNHLSMFVICHIFSTVYPR